MKRLTHFWNRLPDAWRFCLPVWALLRVGTSLWGVLIWKMQLMPTYWDPKYYTGIQPVVNGIGGALLGMWQRWDSIHYQTIAQSGYDGGTVSVFFPFYPLMARGLSALTGMSSLAAMFIISSLAFLGALVLLYTLTEMNFSRSAARGTVFAAALFPTSFFFWGFYPQGLALMLILLAVLLAQKNHWLAAAMVSILAGLTHGSGVPLAALLLVLAVQFVRTATHPLRWSVLAVPFMPLAGTALFLAWRIHMGYPSFNAVQGLEFQREFTAPWTTLWRFAAQLPAKLVCPDWVANAVVLGLITAALIYGVKKLPLAWELYLGASLLFFLISGAADDPLLSLSRLTLTVFPIYTVIDAWIDNRRKRMAAFVLGLLAYSALFSLFLMWKWIA